MKDTRGLIRNIIICQAAILAFQAAFFGFMSIAFAYALSSIILFYVSAVICFCLITLLLILLRGKFSLEDGTKITTINIPNVLSLFRIGSIPTVFFLLLDISDPRSLAVIIPFMAAVFITDFLDGFLARKLRQITLIGKYLDSSSDYLLLFFTSLIFVIYKIIPVWLFSLLVARLALQAAGIAILSFRQKQVVYTISFLGKISIAATMTLFAAELARVTLGSIGLLDTVFAIAELITGAVIAASLVEKALIIKKEWRQKTSH